ncbi:hypothetical protein EH222_13445 [candidate division KSB1 bacterium]|nr:MAG: hypothetical protein EH222_13445 [candidate division KSB1 bacterium]
MAAGGSGAAAAAAAHQRLVQAVRASGVIVQVEPQEFEKLVAQTEKALVVTAKGGVFGSHFKYLVSYKGLAFYTKSRTAIHLPGDAQTIDAAKIWVPGS